MDIEPITQIVGASLELTISELVALNNTIHYLVNVLEDIDSKREEELKIVIELNKAIGRYLNGIRDF